MSYSLLTRFRETDIREVAQCDPRSQALPAESEKPSLRAGRSDSQHEPWDSGVWQIELLSGSADGLDLGGGQPARAGGVLQWHMVTSCGPTCGPFVGPLPCDTPSRTATHRGTGSAELTMRTTDRRLAEIYVRP
jgi:hypothetical protein